MEQIASAAFYFGAAAYTAASENLRFQFNVANQAQSLSQPFVMDLDIDPITGLTVLAEVPQVVVDEIGFADLHPGSGHGWGGFVNVSRIEVYGTPVKR